MKYVQQFLLVQLWFIQSICGYYHNSDGYLKSSIYNPFSDLPIHFDINPQPEEIIPEPRINPHYYPSNYNELVGLPTLFHNKAQSSFQYSFKATPHQSSGISFALMSTHQLAYYFAALAYTRDQILDQYHLYLSDAFIDLVKEFPEYETALKKHCANFLQYKFGKKLAEWFKGNYSRGLAKRLQKLCNRLPKKHIEKSVPVQQRASLKRADFQLADQWWKSLRLHEQYGSESAQRFKNRIEALSNRTLVDGQLAIERLLLQESDDLINIIETDSIREHVGALRSCVTAAREFTQLKQINTASTILDFCWSVTEFAKALTVAAAQEVANVAINVRDHPIECAIVITASVAAPQLLCAYHAVQMIRFIAPIVNDVAAILITASQDREKGLADFKTYISPLTTFVEKIANKEISLTQIAESVIIVAAQTYVQQKLLGGFSSLYGSIKDKAIAWVAKNPSLKFARYLKTPEGMLFQAAQGIEDSCSKRITQTLNRTEDFFKETEFGRANGKYFQKTIYGYHGKRAFQAMKNFDCIKKKQYIVLDGLHKNHLEVYNSDTKWLKVINFDGTLNERLTANAQQGKPRKPLEIMK